MAAKERYPMTQAVRFLKSRGVAFVPHLYDYKERGGTRRASEALGVPEHLFVKTLIMQTDAGDPLVVLMHGDRQVSARNLARVLGVKRVEPCEPEAASRHSGYLVGGTSPFGTRRVMPVYAEASIFDLPRIMIKGGHRGFMLEMDPRELRAALDIAVVDVGIDKTM